MMKLKRKMERWFGKQHNTLLIFALFFLSSGKLEAQVKAKPSDKLVDMIGVCAHFATNFNQYTNSPGDSLREKTATGVATNIRIRHLRDGIYGWKGGTEDFDANGRGIVERFSAISQAGTDAGIPNGITWIITDNTDDWKRLRDNYLIPLGNKVIVLEGANENMGTSGDAQAYQQIKNWWNNILPSLPNLKIATNTAPTAACEIANSGFIGDFVHYGNAHPYHFWPPFKPFGKLSHCNFNSSCAPPTVSLWTAPDNLGGTLGYIEATRKQRVRADQPMIFTEWGYPTSEDVKQNWGVDEDVAAKYVLRGFLEHFNAGILYSCHYQLIDPEPELPFNDDAEAHFGLAYFDGTLKKSGWALKRIIELLEDGGNMNIPTHSFDYSMSGGGLSFTDDRDATTNEIHQTLVQKADSTYYLILWQEAITTNSKGKAINVSPVNVTINFKTAISRLKAYLPATTDNTNPVADTTNIQSYTIAVPDHPVVIEILEKAGTVPVTDMSIVPDAVEMKIGGTVKLSPVITPENASVKRITWSSSNSSTVSVDFTGTIKGLSAGTSLVLAKSINNDVTASCKVKVNAVSVNELHITPEAITVSILETAQLAVQFKPADASDKAIVWTSGDTGIVSVNENGMITGKATGNTIVSVKTVDGTKEATCQVTVKYFNYVDDADGGWVWNGYSNDPCSTCYQGTAHSTNTINATAQYSFTGTEIAAYCETLSGGGFVDVYIDGVLKGSYSQAVPPFDGARQFASIEGLSDTSHTIKFVATSADWIGIDFIRYIGIPPLKGLLTGTFGFKYTAMNLSEETADWRHFSNNDQKANGTKTNSISNLQVIAGVSSVYSDALRKISWTEGTPTFSSSDNTSGVNTSGIGNGFSFTTTAHNASDTLNIYLSGNSAGGTLTAHLSNNSAVDFEKTVATTRTSKWDGIFTLVYNAAQEGKTLDIKWVQATVKGSIGLQAAGISGKTFTSTGNLSDKSSDIQVYPNPFEKGLLAIKMAETGKKTISIIDITGKTVFKVQSANQMIQVPRSSFNRGIYLVTVIDIRNIQRDQLIVQ